MTRSPIRPAWIAAWAARMIGLWRRCDKLQGRGKAFGNGFFQEHRYAGPHESFRYRKMRFIRRCDDGSLCQFGIDERGDIGQARHTMGLCKRTPGWCRVDNRRKLHTVHTRQCIDMRFADNARTDHGDADLLCHKVLPGYFKNVTEQKQIGIQV